MKRVLIITYYWPPSGGAGVQRWLKFSKYLPEFGWDPVILAPDPKQATYPIRDESLKDSLAENIEVLYSDCSEFFSIYKRFSKTSKVPYAGFASESGRISFKQKLSRFIRGNFFLPDPRKGWNKHAISEAQNYLNSNKIDCIITTGPPHSTHLIGLKLKREFNIPWVADFRDPWTDIYYYKDFYPTKLAHNINLNLEKKVLIKADRIITVSPSWKKLFGDKIIEGNKKVEVLTNGFDEEDFKIEYSKASKKKYITYVGTMSDIYPLDSFLNAFRQLIPAHPEIVFRLIGTISNEQKDKITKLPKENIELIPYVDHEKAISYMYEAKALLLLIPEHESSQGIVPGKLFEYFAVGRPVLVIGNEKGDASSLVKSNSAGDFAGSMETDKMRNILHSWLEKENQNNPNQNFNRKIITEQLSRVLDEQIK